MLTFFSFHIFIMSKLHSSCRVDIHDGLMFIIILIVDEWDRWGYCKEEIIHQPDMVCLRYGILIVRSVRAIELPNCLVFGVFYFQDRFV